MPLRARATARAWGALADHSCSRCGSECPRCKRQLQAQRQEGHEPGEGARFGAPGGPDESRSADLGHDPEPLDERSPDDAELHHSPAAVPPQHDDRQLGREDEHERATGRADNRGPPCADAGGERNPWRRKGRRRGARRRGPLGRHGVSKRSSMCTMPFPSADPNSAGARRFARRRPRLAQHAAKLSCSFVKV
jgi:hypothetical protein